MPENYIERSIESDTVKENNNIVNPKNNIIGNERINIIDNSTDENVFTKAIDKNTPQTARNTPQKNIGRVLNKNQNPGIFLAEYNDELGTITLIFKERNLRSNYTLEDILLSLLDGASDKENENNIISVIPRTAKLLDVFRENNTLYLNFSSDFEYNPLGDEGMLVQLYQIVYTVTQFENIDEVIFLVDGNYNEFIGAEGSIANIPFRRLDSIKDKVLETYN